MKKPLKSKRLCVGCRDNFYNGNNPVGVSECWSFKSAKVVRRWRLGWWTRPVEPGAFCEVYTLNCHHAPGEYAMMKELHPEAVNPIRLISVLVLALTVAGCGGQHMKCWNTWNTPTTETCCQKVEGRGIFESPIETATCTPWRQGK